jgi:hypothetical protein
VPGLASTGDWPDARGRGGWTSLGSGRRCKDAPDPGGVGFEEGPYDCGYPEPLTAVGVGGSSKPPSSLEMDWVL